MSRCKNKKLSEILPVSQTPLAYCLLWIVGQVTSLIVSIHTQLRLNSLVSVNRWRLSFPQMKTRTRSTTHVSACNHSTLLLTVSCLTGIKVLL